MRASMLATRYDEDGMLLGVTVVEELDVHGVHDFDGRWRGSAVCTRQRNRA